MTREQHPGSSGSELGNFLCARPTQRKYPYAPFQLDASAKAPCTSTIVGLVPVCPGRWSVASTGEPLAVWIG